MALVQKMLSVAGLPEDLVEKVIESFILPCSRSDLEEHLSICSDIRCHLAQEFSSNVNTIRRVSHNFRNTMFSMNDSLLCITIDDHFLFNMSNYPGHESKLDACLCIEVDVTIFTQPLVREIHELAKKSPNLRRISLRGRFPMGTKEKLQDCFRELVQTLVFKCPNLTSLMLDVTIDVMDILWGRPNYVVLKAHCNADRKTGLAPIVLPHLENLQLQLGYFNRSPTNVLRVLSECTIPNLTNVAIYDRDGMTGVEELVQSHKDSIRELSVFYNMAIHRLSPLPHHTKIQRFSCKISTARSLLFRPQLHLTHLELSGLPKEDWADTSAVRKDAVKFDEAMYNISENNLLPRLEQVKIGTMESGDFLSAGWALHNLAPYVYWAQNLAHRNVEFVDKGNNEMLPNGFLGVKRAPPN